MQILFIHQAFPGQFGRLATYLSREHDVTALGGPSAMSAPGVRLVRYALHRTSGAGAHKFARALDADARRAEEVLYALISLKADGFRPDVVVAHSGWGEGLAARAVFPRAPLLAFCELYHRLDGGDAFFDPEFTTETVDGRIDLLCRNASVLLTLAEAQAGWSPTCWQRSTFPTPLRSQIAVLAEGVDLRLAAPALDARVRLPDRRVLSRDDQVVTYVARELEPCRGFHVFMRALPEILSRVPQAQVVVVGGDGTAYGRPPGEGGSWRELLMAEVASRVDRSRVHFVGKLPYEMLVNVLQVSTVHVYLTYPFVLSWSLRDAMGVGCTLVASDTPPVREFLDESAALLVPFFDAAALGDAVSSVLAAPAMYRSKGEEACRRASAAFDLERNGQAFEVFLKRLREEI